MTAPASMAPGQRPLLPRMPQSDTHLRPASACTALPIQHDEREWTAVYPIIERMYVRERRSLKYLMRAMEENYNFRATVQMYKKRFTKWGFQKNVRRDRRGKDVGPQLPRDSGPPSTALVEAATVSRAPRILHLSTSDAAQLAFLSSIRNWTVSFFDRAEPGTVEHSLPSPPGASSLSPESSIKPPPRDLNNPEQLSFAFKLILGLLDRDQGVLAGRLARKAFLQAETLLDAAGPLFIWNTLEIFHNIALLRQANLGHILLHHLISLAGRRPVSKVLLRLQDLLQAWQHDSIPVRPEVLERAWSINADLTFTRFDPEYLLLYYQLVWDSDIVKLDPEIARHSDKWFAKIHDKVNRTLVHNDVEVATDKLWPKHELIFNGIGMRGDGTSQPASFNHLKQESLAGVTQMLDEVPADSTMRVRVLSAWLKSQVLQDDASMPVHPGMDIPRLQARIMAYITRVMMDFETQWREDADSPTGKMRTILALREYGQGRLGSQIVYEMWQFEDVLVRAGQVEEAAEVRAESYRRLEEFLAEIPEEPHG
ncbi:hypothetical protein CORC01_06574 [Colletotrichum orchidophilum]|uniref:Clr5 domain-containing protein n=1 Tax=Colletotrichum orchidophilum TaxID=1209926 RepID=A0A1G4B9F9_9PEZI|nr:uncharacterized protein CORC01_06574 [Colletotrichum orchidophilum]OHE98060.1 hypothetical protein CORC01_06574 [Colletotrichum orchidophilum]